MKEHDKHSCAQLLHRGHDRSNTCQCALIQFDIAIWCALCLCVCASLQAVVRDVRGLGVMFAPQLHAFTCLTGPLEAIQQRTSLPELTALLQVSSSQCWRWVGGASC